MISRKDLLAKISRAISDKMGVPDNQVTMDCANESFRIVYLNVIIPMLDAFEFDARPIYREVLISQIRDMVAEPDPIPEHKDTIKQGLHAHDDI